MSEARTAEWVAAASVAAIMRSEDSEAAVQSAFELVVKRAFKLKPLGTKVDKGYVPELVIESIHVQLPEQEIGEAVNRLIDARELLVVSSSEGEDSLALAEDVYRDMERDGAALGDTKQRALSGWLAREEELCPEVGDHREELLSVLERHVGEVVTYLNAEAILNWDPAQAGEPVEAPSLDPSRLSNASAFVRQVGVGACERFFREADLERREYLQGVVDGNYELQLLRCTAVIRDVFSAQLAETECYLDTNIILDLIGIESEPDAMALAREAVSYARQLGVQVYVAEETRIEYLRLLEDADRQHKYGRHHGEPDEQGPSHGARSSPFLASYLQALSKERDLTWAEYRKRFESLPALLKEYGVEYAPQMRVQNRTAVWPVAGIFDDMSSHKTAKAKEHDAAMYLLIRKIRSEKGTGLCAWFLTRDHSLGDFEKKALSRLEDIGFPAPSFAVHAHSWIEWLRSRAPGVGVGADDGVIVQLLCDLRFTRVRRDFRVVRRQIEYMESYRDLSPDLIQSQDISRLLDEEFAARGVPYELDDETVNKIVDEAVLSNAERLAKSGLIAESEKDDLAARVKALEESLSESQVQDQATADEIQQLKKESLAAKRDNEYLASQLKRTQAVLVSGISVVLAVGVSQFFDIRWPLLLLAAPPLIWLLILGVRVLNWREMLVISPWVVLMAMLALAWWGGPHYQEGWIASAANPRGQFMLVIVATVLQYLLDKLLHLPKKRE